MVEGTDTPRHLLQRTAAGDKEAFHALYRRYGPRVTAMVRRRIAEPELVEELVQDVFVAAWQTAQGYRSEFGDPERWFLGITRHKLQDHWRRLARIAEAASIPWPESVAETPGIHPEARLSIGQALGTLSTEQRRVIDLIYGYGLTFAETSRALGVPVGTVKSRAHVSLGKLRAFFSRETKS
jgi:RNA polymerase sigma-70 factor (ECF subfamily)